MIFLAPYSEELKAVMDLRMEEGRWSLQRIWSLWCTEAGRRREIEAREVSLRYVVCVWVLCQDSWVENMGWRVCVDGGI